MTISIYGAASELIDKSFIEQTEKLGEMLAKHGHRLVYGAGGTGLMGASARGFKVGGGDVIGVAPHFMHEIEPIYTGCTELIETETMADRKEIMEDMADIFIITPGGIGTLDEFFQCITLSELWRLDKDIIFYNINDYYTKIIEYMEECIDKKFIRERVKDFYKVATTPEEVVDLLDGVLDGKTV